jgi:hypothetical protein
MNPEYRTLDLLTFYTKCYKLHDGIGPQKHIDVSQNAHSDLQKILIFIVDFLHRDDV